MNSGYGLFLFLYHLLWTIGSVMVLPLAWVPGGRRLRERFALDLPRGAPGKGSIWIHALSVGEVLSAVPLVDRLAEEFPDSTRVLTVTTAKGMAVARAHLGGKVRCILTLPVDAWWAVRRMVRYIRPALFILVETDIWPALLEALHRRGVPGVWVNGRVSPRTYRLYRRASFFIRNMLSSLDWCLLQSDLDCARLLRVGVDAGKVRRVGNIKYDKYDQSWAPMTEAERRERRAEICLKATHFIWVAGSTHPGEDAVILRVYRSILSNRPHLRLILAPRRVERGREVFEEARRMGLDPILRTDMSRPCRDYQVLILNTMGELGRLYGLADIGFVGGSLVPFGGHNLLEPASFGLPVVFGPYTHNFVDMSRLLAAEGGGWRVADEKELLEAMERLMEDGDLRLKMGERSRRFVQGHRGAVERIIGYLHPNRA